MYIFKVVIISWFSDNALGFKYDLIAGDIVLEGHNGQSRILKDYLVHEKFV